MVLTFLLKKEPVWETLFKPSLFTYIQRVVAQILLYSWHQISHRMLAGSPYPNGPQNPVAVSGWPAQWWHWVGQCVCGGGGVRCHSYRRRWKAKPESRGSVDKGIVPDPYVANLEALSSQSSPRGGG